MTTETRSLIEWALGDNTGSSSKFIASHLSGVKPSRYKSHPVDGGDFERCLGLLKAVPSFRDRLKEMAEVDDYWKALVVNWDRIESANTQERYKIMRSILDPIEKQDSFVIRLNENMTVRFS